LRGMARMLAERGVTSFLPTTVPLSWERLESALIAIDQVSGERTGGARVIGSHMEGPFCSPLQAGALNPRYLLEPRPEQYLPLLDRLKCLRRVSAAPELSGALELGRELSRRGIVVSMAHTDATFQQVMAALGAGYSHATHIFTCMSTVRRDRAYRVTGVLESVLLLDEIATEVIADGHHLPPSLLRLVIKVKGIDAVAAISDSMPAAGQGPGHYIFGGLEVIVESAVADSFEVAGQNNNLVAKLPDRSAFAGSVATMDQTVQNMVRLAGLSLADAIRTATATPARLHGISDRGVLEPGRKADIVVLDESITPLMTIVEGEVVYRSGAIPAALTVPQDGTRTHAGRLKC
jgi:N-acetylglucosamine-6-phosphate deacetylase